MNLYTRAIIKADEIRTQLGMNIFQPVNIFDACAALGVTVRFVNINMEGLYLRPKNGIYPTILLSNQRPFPRRCFTCAHELGHHVFNHGLRLDTLEEQQISSTFKDSDEQLVDSFAGALLMPIVGIQAEFSKRNWQIQEASPTQFYTISSVFGIGYQTLIVHCKANRLISDMKAKTLEKVKPAQLLGNLLGAPINEKSHFKIIDDQNNLPVIDLEVTNYITLPPDTVIEGDHLQKLHTPNNTLHAYKAVKPGIVRAIFKDGTCSSFIRIQNYEYVGLAEYRHLEEVAQ